MSFCFGDSVSGGLERIHFLLKETWTLLLLVEAGNGPFSSILSLTLNSEFANFLIIIKRLLLVFYIVYGDGPITLYFLSSVVTLVYGWMRICILAAAAPASPSTTVASQKPMTFESWIWRPGRSAEDTLVVASTCTVTTDQLCP